MIVLFFLMPVVLTAVFSFTNMTTATGISGGAYQIAPNALDRAEVRHAGCRATAGRAALRDRRGRPQQRSKASGLIAGIATELREKHLGEVFPSRREAERMIKDAEGPALDARDVKQISEQFNRSVVNTCVSTSKDDLFAALDTFGFKLTPEQKERPGQGDLYRLELDDGELLAHRLLVRIWRSMLLNTLLYVALVLVSVQHDLRDARSRSGTHYMPDLPATIFRVDLAAAAHHACRHLRADVEMAGLGHRLHFRC